MAIFEPGSRLLSDTISAVALILDFPSSRSMRNKWLLFNPPDLLSFVIAAQTETVFVTDGCFIYCLFRAHFSFFSQVSEGQSICAQIGSTTVVNVCQFVQFAEVPCNSSAWFSAAGDMRKHASETEGQTLASHPKFRTQDLHTKYAFLEEHNFTLETMPWALLKGVSPVGFRNRWPKAWVLQMWKSRQEVLAASECLSTSN